MAALKPDSLDALWYRVANIRLALRSHVDIHRHTYRDEPWYVVQDHTTGRYFRLSPGAYRFIGQLDGERTLNEIWHDTRPVNDADHESGASKGELIRMLAQLYRADLLSGDVMPDTAELVQRAQGLRQRQQSQRWRSPIAIRLPLLDPDRFLNATWPVVRYLFSPAGLLLWLVAMAFGATLVATHWQGLTSDILGRVLSAENALLLLLIFPVVKTLHEFGHAYAIKAMGGEVHEMGVILLVFVPIPYVDASSASANKHSGKRALVGAAGMLIELFVAVIALTIWAESEPGLVQAIAYNIILVAGVSTVFFNANPLVRFDGYYIFSDLIEVPNLSSRAYQYLGYLYKKYVIRLPDLEPFRADPTEKKWLAGYAVGAFLYRLFIVVAIVWLLLDGFFFFGVLLACWAVVMMIFLPINKTAMFLFRSNQLHGHRTRAIGVTVALLVGLGGLLAIPVPFSAVAEGVVWVDQQSWVRNRSEGFVTEVAVVPKQLVEPGQALLRLANVDLDAQVARLKLYLEELAAQYDALRYADRVQASLVREQIDTTASQLIDLETRRSQLVVTSDIGGRFINVNNNDLIGRFLPKGSLLGFIADEREPVVRVVVNQGDIDLVRNSVRKVEVRFSGNLSQVVPGQIVREIPGASQTLPSLALSSQGGGKILLDPSNRSGGDPSSLQSFFQFDVVVPGELAPDTWGGRVVVRFSFGYEPLAMQLYRPIKQTFLSKFG